MVAMQRSGEAGWGTCGSGSMGPCSLRTHGSRVARAPPSVHRVTRRAGSAGALALVALSLAGCGSGVDSARVTTAAPIAFVDSVRGLVAPAERMAVVASASLGGEGGEPSAVELNGLMRTVRTSLSDFAHLRLGDPALRAEQSRLVRVMHPVVARMRAVRIALNAQGHAGLAPATAALLNAIRRIPSAAAPSRSS